MLSYIDLLLKSWIHCQCTEALTNVNKKYDLSLYNPRHLPVQQFLASSARGFSAARWYGQQCFYPQQEAYFPWPAKGKVISDKYCAICTS